MQNRIPLRQMWKSGLAGFFKRGEYHMSASKQTAFDYIDEKAGVITDVSDKIWDYAELSFRESTNPVNFTQRY